MSIGKATAPPAAEMLSTMEVRARMFPSSGESAALRRSAKKRDHTFSVYSSVRFVSDRVWSWAHPRRRSSVCTVRECCSTPGCCSRCCLSWARLMTTPATTEIDAHAQVAVIHSVL